ncbi:MAG: ribonuclease Z [Actinomycetota bacterium]|nr:ribonuclease Z [Actinomycetota bacterium]
MDLDVLFIGTAGSAPSARRALPATLIRRGGDRLLVDCGEGTQRQLLRSVGLVELDEIFVTHFHADHFLGLPGMLKTYSLRGRETPLTVYGPPGLKALFAALRPVVGRTAFDLRLVELEPNEVLRRDGYRIAAFAVDHGVTAYGYALVEEPRPGRFDEARARELGVVPGPDFGRLQRGEAVSGADGVVVPPEEVLGPPRRGRKVVLAGDTTPFDTTRVAAHEADLLVHEATFLEEEAERARETGHSTARGAAELAAAAEVRLLALTHVSPRYAGGELRDEARAVFERTIVPRDLDRVEVPFPERGSPVHVRADGPRRAGREASPADIAPSGGGP